MPKQTIPVVDFDDWNAGGSRLRGFAAAVGDALREVGFFALEHHGVTDDLLTNAFEAARRFADLPEETKRIYERPGVLGQRGHTPYGRERAKDAAPSDLKEFFQIGRTDVPDDHPVHGEYGANPWPDDHVPEFRGAMSALYGHLNSLADALLEACALYISAPPTLFSEMARDGDTILRVIHYPPVPQDAPAGAVRAAAHEDINLVTLLCGATADGLELLDRSGEWVPITAWKEHVIVDSGDMLQAVTNGLYRSTTHRVVNPSSDAGASDRFTMPFFVHPRGEVDLTPLPECIARTGGKALYGPKTAREILQERLNAIGLG